VAVSSANDASQDYKTLQLGDIPPREGFLAQILGLCVGAVFVPLSFAFAHSAFGMGTSELVAPQGELFATIIRGILIDQKIPWYPVFIGVFIGVVAVIIEIVAARNNKVLPAMAFAVGLYLPPDLGVAIIFGAGCRYFGERAYERDNGKAERTYESILSAAGMITGAAIYKLIIGIAVLFGVSPSGLHWGLWGSGADGAPLPDCKVIGLAVNEAGDLLPVEPCTFMAILVSIPATAALRSWPSWCRSRPRPPSRGSCSTTLVSVCLKPQRSRTR